MIVLSQSTHRARKEHQCGECLGTIGIGDSYERARVVDGGDAWTWKAHHLCHSVSIELTRELDLMPDDLCPDCRAGVESPQPQLELEGVT